MSSLKFHLHYYKVLMRFNLPFSLVVSLTGLIFSQHVLIRMINAFSLSLLTGGFVIALYLFEQRYSGQYYFYHNKGLSRVMLIATAFALNVIMVIFLFFLKLYLYA